MSYPMNCWYVVAWSHEVPAVGMFTRTVLDQPLLIYRTAAGAIVALEDRCCHRHAPLSLGRQEGDAVRCGYHGLLFGPDGRCIEVPGMQQPPSRACVRSFPVVEKNRWVFVWMGDAAAADPALLPDNGACDDSGWHYRPGYLHYDAPHALICDNLLDFSHLSWVHANTLGGSEAIALATPEVTALPRGVRVVRHVAGVPPPPYYAAIRRFEGLIHRWFDYDFLQPGILLMRSGGHLSGDSPQDPERSVQLRSCQALTPETATTSHYFFMQAHPAHIAGDELSDVIHGLLIQAFEEDRAMITAQATRMDASRPMLPLHFDKALLMYRRSQRSDSGAPLGA
ncbi:Rieske 2Fe-2S domain-containing protein [Paucibacter sp. JuS9]|uniref:Rieske 2Fe-2S domain-containing protein n=1 Tax=Paucibacter sp. JuS9 TaxID=3228748 RepID=UPI0037570816